MIDTSKRFQVWYENSRKDSGRIFATFDSLVDAKEFLIDTKLEHESDDLAMAWEYDEWQISYTDPVTQYRFRYFIMDCQSESELHRMIAQEEVYTMQGDVTDRHITLEEGIEWLTRLGATDVRAIGDYLLSGIDTDGYAFLTDIREHALSSVIAHSSAQVEMVDGQYETYAQYADRLDNLRNGAPIDALQAKLEGYALIQLEHAHSVLPDGTEEFMAVQEELKRRESLPYVWSIQYFTSQGLEEARELEEYATLAEIRACMADIHTSHWEYHVSADGLQKVMYSSQLDFGFIHYVTRGGVVVAPYAYATPMEEGSVNLDQVPYDGQVVDAICAANAARLQLSDTQQKLMGEQMEYWGNRFDRAWDRADYDDCEFCACYVVALQAIFGTL